MRTPPSTHPPLLRIKDFPQWQKSSTPNCHTCLRIRSRIFDYLTDARPTGEPEIASPATFFRGEWSWNSFFPFRWFKKRNCQFLAKETENKAWPGKVWLGKLTSSTDLLHTFWHENLKCMSTKTVITKTRLFKNTEKFTTKKWKFSDKKTLIFFIFLLKT